MKKILGIVTILFAFSTATFAQEKESKEHIKVPAAVQTALQQKYPEAKNVGWEKEDGNYKEKTFYEAEVHGHDVIFDGDGDFVKAEK